MAAQFARRHALRRLHHGLLIASLLLYIITYFALVVPGSKADVDKDAPVAFLFWRIPEYRVGGNTLASIFRPIHIVDARQLRRRTWSYEIHFPLPDRGPSLQR